MLNTLVLQTVDDCQNVAPISRFHNAVYADYHKYDMVYKHHVHLDYSSAWDKVLFLLEELTSKAYQYIYVLSGSSVIKDIRMGLKELLEVGRKDILMFRDESGSFSNSGFLVHNTRRAHMFFTELITYANEEAPLLKNIPLGEISAIGVLYPKWEGIIDVCPKPLFNLQ